MYDKLWFIMSKVWVPKELQIGKAGSKLLFSTLQENKNNSSESFATSIQRCHCVKIIRREYKDGPVLNLTIFVVLTNLDIPVTDADTHCLTPGRNHQPIWLQQFLATIPSQQLYNYSNKRCNLKTTTVNTQKFQS